MTNTEPSHTSDTASRATAALGAAQQVLAEAGFSFQVVPHCPWHGCTTCSGSARHTINTRAA